MKPRKQVNGKRVRAVVYLPPATYKALQKAADGDSLKVSQKGAQIIIEAMKDANT
jgi:formylmethanofuran dehydrogenase subunit D